MIQSGTLQQLLLEKYQRQKRLGDKFREMEDLKTDLSVEQFGRFFGTSYLAAKRMITLVIGVIITVLAFLLLIQPDLILTDEFTEEIVKEVATEQMELADALIQDIHIEVYEGRKLYLYEFRELMEPILNFEIKEEFQFTIHSTGYALLIIGLIILYVSRLTRKMWTRNSRIAQEQIRTKQLIEEFRLYVEEDEKELMILQGIVNEHNK